jgi:hypothetical protein
LELLEGNIGKSLELIGIGNTLLNTTPTAQELTRTEK